MINLWIEKYIDNNEKDKTFGTLRDTRPPSESPGPSNFYCDPFLSPVLGALTLAVIGQVLIFPVKEIQDNRI